MLALCIEQIPNTAGLKHSAPNPLTLQRCARMEGMEVFWGSDENLLLGLSLGATAAIGSTYNLAITKNWSQLSKQVTSTKPVPYKAKH